MTAPLPFAAGRDLLGLGQTTAAWLLATALPERSLPAAARLLAALELRANPGRWRSLAQSMQRRLGETEADPMALAAEHVARRYEHVLGRMLDTRARGWHPHIELQGELHLREALAGGRGAVLWGMSFCGPVIHKAALNRAGHRETHLAVAYHGGFSRSWVAVHLLNPWTIRAEDRHLKRRIVIPLDGSLDYLLELKKALGGNGCVSIMGEHAGMQNVTIPLLCEATSFATGAVSLARSAGAPLLTFSAHRTGPFRYVVEVDAPIRLDFGRGRREGTRAVVEEFAARLERAIRRHPADWERWSVVDIVEPRRPPQQPVRDENPS